MTTIKTNDNLINIEGDYLDFTSGEVDTLEITDTLLLPDGDTNNLILAFKSSPTTGFYLSSGDRVVLETADDATAIFSPTEIEHYKPLRAARGSNITPTYSFRFDTNTGFYRLVDDSGLWRFSSNEVDTVHLNSTGLLVQDGSAADPSLSFIDDPETGLYSSSIGKLDISVSGEDRIKIQNNLIRIFEPTRIQTATEPLEVYCKNSGLVNLMQFLSDVDDGDGLDVGSRGFLRIQITTVGHIRGTAGTKTAPSYSFLFDSDTGMYNSGANELAFSLGDFEHVKFQQDTTTFYGNQTGSPLIQLKLDDTIYNTIKNGSSGDTLEVGSLGNLHLVGGLLGSGSKEVKVLLTGQKGAGDAKLTIDDDWSHFSLFKEVNDFTPSFTAVDNISTITSPDFRYTKINNFVSVSMRVTVDVVATGAFRFQFSLPDSSTTGDLVVTGAGYIAAAPDPNTNGAIITRAVNVDGEVAYVWGNSTTAASRVWFFALYYHIHD